MEKSIIDFLKPEQSFYKRKLCQEHDIPMVWIAGYIGRSLSHTCNLLNGHATVSQDIKVKLDSLLSEVEKVLKSDTV